MTTRTPNAGSRAPLTALNTVLSATLGTLLLTLAACGGPELRTFPLQDPLWVDPDETGLPEALPTYFSGFAWDAIDQTAFIPMSRYLSVDVPGPATNVNALDEVPDSSWFTNRLGLFDMTDEALQRGACPEQTLDENGAWTVIAGKPNGANPGFVIRDEQGRGWVLKFDGEEMHERATAADVFGSRVYHAAGYWSPCNVVVYFDPAVLTIGDDAETEDAIGNDGPMEDHHIQGILESGIRLEDGRYRASASLFLPGIPIGPFTYQGRRRDDPNDVIRHQDRRELRGSEVIAAWLNHFDAREQNSLNILVEEGERTFVRHYFLDFGDCLGSQWAQDALSRRFGNSFYFDAAHVAADFFSLGGITRPWETAAISPVANALGYFDAERLVPDRYHAGYPNPAFAAMRGDDGAWGARILARFDEHAVRVMLRESQISDQTLQDELVRVLMARRQRLLAHHLAERSPLANFEVQPDGTTVCFEDLSTMTGVTRPTAVRYDTATWTNDWTNPRWIRHETDAVSDPRRVCISLVGDQGQRSAIAPGAADDDPSRYQITDITLVPEPGAPGIPPARLHFYDLGERGFRLVGIERPADNTPPGNRP